jgi:hypothetical protein
MKSLQCLSLFCFVLVSDVSFAAVVNLTFENGMGRPMGSSPLLYGGLGSYGSLNSYFGTAEAEVDTAADTGRFTSFDMNFAQIGGGTRTSSVSTVIPPSDFPGIPTTITTTFTETVNFDPISDLTNLEAQFVSSTTAPITYVFGTRYRFTPNVTLSFPSSFTLSGTYHLQGPTQTVDVPLNVVYSRTGSPTVAEPWINIIDVGLNFPETASLETFFTSVERTYRPGNATVFTGIVDGRSFDVRLPSVTLTVRVPVPEPTSAMLAAVGAIVSCQAIGRRLGRPMHPSISSRRRWKPIAWALRSLVDRRPWG